MKNLTNRLQENAELFATLDTRSIDSFTNNSSDQFYEAIAREYPNGIITDIKSELSFSEDNTKLIMTITGLIDGVTPMGSQRTECISSFQKPTLLDHIKSHLKSTPVTERLHPDFKIVLSYDACKKLFDTLSISLWADHTTDGDEGIIEFDETMTPLLGYNWVYDPIQTKHFDFYNPVKAMNPCRQVAIEKPLTKKEFDAQSERFAKD